MFLRNRIAYSPADEGGGAGAGEGEKTQNQNAGKGEFDSRPDWLPEQFYNADTKGPRIREMAKSWGDLRATISKGVDGYKQQFEAQERERIAKIRPADPNGYKVQLNAEKFPNIVLLDKQPGEDFKPEDGKHYAVLSENDPMLQWWKKTSHEIGLSHEQFSEAVANYFQTTLSKQPVFEKEMEKLGEGAKERIAEMDTWMRGNLTEASYKALEGFAKTAAGIEAIENLISASGGPKLGAKNGPTSSSSGEKLTREKIREMMNDPRYWHHTQRDATFVKEVQDAYGKLFSGQVATAPLSPSR